MERVGLSEREAVEAVEKVHLSQLAAGERASVQGFEIEPGATVPEHSHHHEQVGFVYEGELTFIVDAEEREARSASSGSSSAELRSADHSSGRRGGETAPNGTAEPSRGPREDGEQSDPREIVVGPGDSFAIPGDEPHAAENRGETAVRGIDVFSPPRLDPDWAE